MFLQKPSHNLRPKALESQKEAAPDLVQDHAECHLVLGGVVFKSWKQNAMFYCGLEDLLLEDKGIKGEEPSGDYSRSLGDIFWPFHKRQPGFTADDNQVGFLTMRSTWLRPNQG